MILCLDKYGNVLSPYILTQKELEKRAKEIPAVMPESLAATIWEHTPVVGDILKENRY